MSINRLIAIGLAASVLMAAATGCGKVADAGTNAPADSGTTAIDAGSTTPAGATGTTANNAGSTTPNGAGSATSSKTPIEEPSPSPGKEEVNDSSNETSDSAAYTKEKASAISALTNRQKSERDTVYVYKDFSMTSNHFTQKAKMAGKDDSLVKDMDENWQEDPYSGTSCIRCEVSTRIEDWGGEKVEFFTAGFGYDGSSGKKNVEYPDSAKKQSAGWIELTDQWEEYVIPLENADMSYIVCGFGYVLNDQKDGVADNVFYLDEIRFCGDIKSAQSAPVMLRSYDTENVYIQNAAFTYDNALAGMAFISEGMQPEAQQVMDAFVYAVQNDRALRAAAGGPMRLRNAYAAGDISAFPGWESGAKLPGWYDNETGEWYEDRYQVGSNVGNTSYAAMALMQYYKAYGGEQYLQTARSLMDWVIEDCSDGGDGFVGGFDGWHEGDPPVVYPFTYKSIEHNIDAYAVFSALYKVTGESKYREAADSALRFIESMYDEEQGLFMTGTLDDGVTPNKSVIVLDAQVWCQMALGDAFEPYKSALDVVDKMRSPEGAYPFCLENKNGGWWAEGTAYTALMYRVIDKSEEYRQAMDALASIQLENGLFPAATVDNLSTGMDLFDGSPWEYSTDAHIAPTAWFVMAANGFNPYVY